MKIEDRIKLALSRGYRCNVIDGIVYGAKGKELTSVNLDGYKVLSVRLNKKDYKIYHHQFIFYCMNNFVASCIDHIDGDKLNNRIDNLREVTKQQNGFNTKAKGAYKIKNKFMAQIVLDQKPIYLGLYNTEEEAHQAYLNAKKIYHKI